MRNKILTLPNILSFIRLSMIPFMVWLYCIKAEYAATGCLLILSGITDVVDGFIARRFNMITELGKVLDPIADKFTQAAMLLCLFVRFPRMMFPFVFMIAKELFMTISGYLIIKNTGIVLGAEWHGKIATVLLYAMMILHIFWFDIPATVSDITIIICIGMITMSYIFYAIRNLRALLKCNK